MTEEKVKTRKSTKTKPNVVKKAQPKVEPAKSTNSASGAKITKDVYYDNKRRVLGWEKNNYTKLAVLVDSNGMCKMFDHSAIIFAGSIAKRVEMRAELTPDTDFELMTDKPVCLVRNLDTLERKLKTVKIYRSSMDAGVVVFDLGYKVDASDLIEMQKHDELMRERINKLVLPTEVFPALRFELEKLTKMVFEAARKMDAISRELVGQAMFSLMAEMMEKFIEMANGHENTDEYLKMCVVNLRRVDAKIKLISDLRLLEEKKILSMLLQLNVVQRKLAGVIQNRADGRNKKS